ncbi:hypothetical protein [Candidatus Cyanaurora vandensis]|uniref:hypothetical protein n=1 Tax=Candidatus Cyanaurora vandensis TaxID=2714958 RepID=UPI00257D9D7D|nr:hypothetical protein [Candidatus Cyanaurora vandensis]
MNRQKPDEPQEIRYTMTTKIWGYATGMLGISIPLAAITESPLIPLAVVVGTAISTAAVWGAFGKTTPPISAPQLKQLEERLANLETIVSYEEDNTLKAKIQKLKSTMD